MNSKKWKLWRIRRGENVESVCKRIDCLDAILFAYCGLFMGGQRTEGKEAQTNRQRQEAEIMGELGDWGYWLLFIVMAAICYVWGYANGYTEGKKDGQKEKRHIDAKI